MPRIGDFEAYIAVDSRPLPMFAIESNPTERIQTCWIPARTSQIFTVNWACFKDISWTTCGDVTIDGVGAGGMTLKPSPPGAPYRRFSCVAEMGFVTDPDEPFEFGYSNMSIESTDGEIRLDIYRIPEITQAEADNPSFKCILVCPWKKTVTEGARWKYQKEATLNRIERLATFVFRYRTHEKLEESGLKDCPLINLPSGSPEHPKTQDQAVPNIEAGSESPGPSQPSHKPMVFDPLKSMYSMIHGHGRSRGQKRKRPDSDDLKMNDNNNVEDIALSSGIEGLRMSPREVTSQALKKPKLVVISSQKLKSVSQQASRQLQKAKNPNRVPPRKYITRSVAEKMAEAANKAA